MRGAGAGGDRSSSPLTMHQSGGTRAPHAHSSTQLPLAPGALRSGYGLAFSGLGQRQGGRRPTVPGSTSHRRGLAVEVFPSQVHWAHPRLRGL